MGNLIFSHVKNAIESIEHWSWQDLCQLLGAKQIKTKHYTKVDSLRRPLPYHKTSGLRLETHVRYSTIK